MAHILLGATGSVAAIRVPEMYRQLRLAGHAVKVVATRAAPCVREIQPWSMPMPMAVSPNPTAAMLQAELIAVRSGTRPLFGLARYQK